MALQWLCMICFIQLFDKIAAKEDIWYSYQFNSGHGNREELVISRVDAVDGFRTENNVHAWRTLSLKHKSYALGIAQNGIVALQATLDDDNIITNSSHTQMNGTIIDAFLFENWNETAYTNDVIAVVALARKNRVELKGYKFTDDNQLICGWTQVWMKNVTHLNVFKVDNRWHILICNDRYMNYTTADLYEFVLGSKPDFWLIQKINLTKPTRTSTVTTHGIDTYLSIPQQDEIVVYRYERNHFLVAFRLPAKNATHAISFKIGFDAFLAVDGDEDAGIYKFGGGGLRKQVVRDANLERVDRWMSVPVRTYRDDEILIAERALDHGTHASYDVQAVLYNGGAFTVHEEMECYHYGEMVHGMNCLVDEERHSAGINGAGFLILGDVIGVLVPRNGTTSRLFRMRVELRETASPLTKQVESLKAFRQKLQLKINERKERLSNVQSSLKHTVKPHEENIISAPWTINTLATPILKQTNDAVFNIPQSPDLQPLFDRIAAIKNHLKQLNESAAKIKEAETRAEFSTLILGGPVKINSANVETIEAEVFNNGFNFADYVQVNEERVIDGLKTFSNVVIGDLFVGNVNGIDAGQFVYGDQERVEIEGDVVFVGEVAVQGDARADLVNDDDLFKDLVTVGVHYEDEITFENITARETLDVKTANKVPIHDDYLAAISGQIKQADIQDEEFETLYVPGNITVATINGENFAQFLAGLSMRNLKYQYIPGSVEIKGAVNAVHSELGTLNGRDFSTQFVFANGNQFTPITGVKEFRNEIRIRELTTDGDVNGINTADIVTLSGDQELSGKITFDNLHVIERLNVSENVNIGLDKTALNPTLLQTDTITANCNFNQLEIDGVIKITNSLNELPFRNTLADIVYASEPEAEIASVKEFPGGLTVRGGLNVRSNAINSKQVSDFVGRKREEVLKPRTLNGDVAFVNLHLRGDFGGVDVLKLVETSVKTTGEQTVHSELIFERGISVNALNITQTLNDLDLSAYLRTNGIEIAEHVDAETIAVEHLFIGGDLNADSLDFPLEDYNERRVSLSKEQSFSGDIVLKNAHIEDFSALLFNGYTFESLFGLEAYAENVKRLLENGNITVKEMLIENSLNISSIDDVKMDEILKNCVWTDEKEHRISLKIKGNVEFNSLQADFLNGVNFTEFAENAVRKSRTDMTFTAPKLYYNGFEVFNYINTPSINEIRVDNILRKGGEQTINSQIFIDGDVSIKSDFTAVKLNNFTLDDLNMVFAVVDENTYKIMGHVDFKRNSYINNLTLTSSINQENIDDFFSSLINVNQDTNLTGTLVFEKPVTIAGNLAAKNGVNGININTISEDIVFITRDASVEGLVVFARDLIVNETLQVDRDLESPAFMGMDLSGWMNESVFINRGQIPGTLRFEEAIVEDNIIVNNINQVDVNSLIPLRAEQRIPLEFSFGELSSYRDIAVGNQVNGRKLQEEYHNTVMSGRIQEVNTNVIFNANVLIHGGLTVLGRVNGNDITRIVTLNGNERLHAIYHFKNRTTVLGDAFIRGERLNGVNLTRWISTSLKKTTPHVQLIAKRWDVDGSVIFAGDVGGNGTINGLDIAYVAGKVDEMKVFKENVETDLVGRYRKICAELNWLVAGAKQQIFLFDYLDYHQVLDFNYGIANIHQFKFKDFNYMLATDETSCFSELFFWNGTRFSSVRQIDTGKIAQMITVKDRRDNVFLVGRHGDNDRDCNFVGANIWKVSIDNIQVLYAIDECSYLQESIVPGTFYTLDSQGVYEYRLVTESETNVHKVRRWSLDTANAVFIPRGMNMGLSLRNGQNLIELRRDGKIADDELGLSYNTYNVLEGFVHFSKNRFLPGRNDGEMIVLNVTRANTFAAVSTLQTKNDANRLKQLDYINIYDDVRKGKVFNKILANEPTSLLSLQFGGNGESLLVFLENRELLNVYEYKGIEGFKRKLSVRIRGTKLINFSLPYGENKNSRNFIGVINGNRLTLLQAVMKGDQINDENVQCTL